MIERKYAYMVRSDGNLLNAGVYHPYILYDPDAQISVNIADLFLTDKWCLSWFYNNTLFNKTKDDIASLIKSYYNINDDVLSEEEKKYFHITESTPCLDDIKSLYDLYVEVNTETNQEFLRCRYGGSHDNYGENTIYFRISSVGVNWYNIIWDIVERNKGDIDNVSVVYDYQALKPYKNIGEEEYCKINNTPICNMPVDDFLTMKGNPIVEKYLKGSCKFDIRKNIFNYLGKYNRHYKNLKYKHIARDLID